MNEVELVMEWLRHPGSKVFNGVMDEIKTDLLSRLLKCSANDAGTIGKLQGEITIIDMMRADDFHKRLREAAAKFIT